MDRGAWWATQSMWSQRVGHECKEDKSWAPQGFAIQVPQSQSAPAQKDFGCPRHIDSEVIYSSHKEDD